MNIIITLIFLPDIIFNKINFSIVKKVETPFPQLIKVFRSKYTTVQKKGGLLSYL